ncbi:Ig-like domain-containing protein [Kribbella sp. CA-293567]|uniref:Ig-like domain-containing protein n=1 Tax=Kribbella sp. CA-293567 TaxID=3002436 RepID=UPI0022DE94F5|nr:Ig-like domain-containing protein [Kribbella sp. CA-293567]WBQ07314.1 Ig-like domain-containing protein [Kribbella sp. CA-293567]
MTRSGHRLPVVLSAASLGVALLATTVTGPAIAYQVPSAPFAQGNTATATMPGSGLTQTITVTGQTELLDATTAGVRGSTGQTYDPAIARTTPAQDLLVNTGSCAAIGTCGHRGTLTITFSQPVRNPILHLAGIGGAVTQTTNDRVSAQSELHAVLSLTTAGLSLTKVGKGNNLAVGSDSIRPLNPDAGPNCVNTDTGQGPDSVATAACGSVRVNGVAKSISFDLTAVFTKNPKLPAFNTASSADAFSVVASASEDFGDAPASYGAAWSVLGDLRLGGDATEDNRTVANGTTGPATQDQADDGVVFKPLVTVAKSYSAAVALSGASKAGHVCGWIDLDKNGKFDTGERACATFAAGRSAVTLTWPTLPKLTAGTTYARVRAGYSTAQVIGAADTGEVEDHPVVIAPPPPPIALDDAAATPYDTGVTTDVLGNDKPGDPASPLTPGTLCLVSGDKCGVMVNVVAEGKYVAKPDGRISFEPVPGFVGPGKPVTYRIADTNGTTATAKLTVTVALPAKPVAVADQATTLQNVSLALTPLANDVPAPGVTLVPGSLVLRDPADAAFRTAAEAFTKKVIVPDEGTYVVKPDGTVDFLPLPQFTGVATTLGYRVTDSTRQVAESTLAVTVTPVTPKAAGDSVSTPFDTPVEVAVLDNDLPGTAEAPLDPLTLKLVDPAGGKLVDQVTVPRQGTYTVAEGKVRFGPQHGFRGVTTPLVYQVLDKNGTAARAQLTVSVDAPGPPVANPDRTTLLQGGSVFVQVLDNDKPGPTGATLVPGSLRLLAPDPAAISAASVPPVGQTPAAMPASRVSAEPVTTVVVAGQGKYTAKPDGRVLFESVPAFSGRTTPITYLVADGNGAIGRATLTLEVTKVQPDATDDTAGTAYDRIVIVDVLANDKAGDPAVPLVPSSLKLIDPLTDRPQLTVVVDGEGTFKVVADSKVQFDPLPTYTGVATALAYTVSDVNGTLAPAKLTVTVAKPPPPAAKPDTATTKQDDPVTLDPLVNDEPGQGTGLDPLSVVLIDPADGSLKKVVTIAGQGTYHVNPDGTVGFDPLPAFTGTATTVTYRVSDWFDQATRSTITVGVTPIVPTAEDDTATSPYGATATVKVLGNDKPGDLSAPLVVGSLVLKDPADGLFKTVVTIKDEGVYTARAGVVAFVPAAGFSGPGTALTYQVADDNGTTATAEVWITVGLPPVARADNGSTLQNVTVTVDVLSNDQPGTGAKLDPASVVIGLPDVPAAEGIGRAARFGKTATVPGQGKYTVQKNGSIQLDPVPAFSGRGRLIQYQVTDSQGNTASSTLGIAVTGVQPFTVDDSAITPFNRPITLNVLTNDKPGDPSAPLVPTSLLLQDPADATKYQQTVTQPGEGTYTAKPDGSVTFVPVKDYQGMTTPATYRISDANGTPADGLLFLTVGKGPEAKPDTSTTRQNVNALVEPLANDRPGTDAELEKTSVELYDGKAWGKTATVAGQGTYKVDAVTGKLTFDPVPTFSGPSSIAYRVTDTANNKATSTVTVTVTAIVPDAADDAATTAFDTPATVPVLANDKPGDASSPLDAASVRLIDFATGDPVASLLVAGQGTYTVQPDGAIRLQPWGGWTGPATPVTYQVSDTNGSAGTATLVVTVGAKPVALPDVTETKQQVAVTFDPLTNDKPGAGATLDPATLLLVNASGDLVDRVSVQGQGSYAVANGKITFTPVTAFVGSTRPTAYEVKDSNRNPARSTVSVTVLPVRPVAVNDSASTPYGQGVVVAVLGNDKAGDPSAPLVTESVVLRDPADGKDKTSVTVAEEGSFVARPDGTVGYTPVKGFTGTTRSITYRVTDANGTSDTARLEITVGAPSGAKAIPDSGTGSLGNPVVVNPLLNDVATRGAAWDPGSVCLVTGPATCGKQVTVPNVGGWTVGTDGSVRFVPERGFTGTAKQPYRVTDTEGVTVDSQVRVTVGAQPAAQTSVRRAAGGLPDTGGPSVLLLTLAGLLVGLGVTLMRIARRGRQ